MGGTLHAWRQRDHEAPYPERQLWRIVQIILKYFNNQKLDPCAHARHANCVMNVTRMPDSALARLDSPIFSHMLILCVFKYEAIRRRFVDHRRREAGEGPPTAPAGQARIDQTVRRRFGFWWLYFYVIHFTQCGKCCGNLRIYVFARRVIVFCVLLLDSTRPFGC